jgi:hypothetical protein
MSTLNESDKRIKEIEQRIKNEELQQKEQHRHWHDFNAKRQEMWERRGARDDDREHC